MIGPYFSVLSARVIHLQQAMGGVGSLLPQSSKSTAASEAPAAPLVLKVSV